MSRRGSHGRLEAPLLSFPQILMNDGKMRRTANRPVFYVPRVACALTHDPNAHVCKNPRPART